MNQWEPAPAPTKTEFDTLNSTVSSLSDKIANKIKTTTFSGTTDANGNVELTALPVATYYIVNTLVGNVIATPYAIASGNWALHVQNTNGTIYANTALSGRVYYCDR